VAIAAVASLSLTALLANAQGFPLCAVAPSTTLSERWLIGDLNKTMDANNQLEYSTDSFYVLMIKGTPGKPNSNIQARSYPNSKAAAQNIIMFRYLSGNDAKTWSIYMDGGGQNILECHGLANNEQIPFSLNTSARDKPSKVTAYRINVK
jgi:hypothetical protein